MEKYTLLKNQNKKNLQFLFKKKFKNKNDIDLLILTTAINRPLLHNISFKNYSTFLPKDINIKWIINIDFINFDKKSIAEEELEFTKNNILEIFKDYTNIDFEFTLNKIGGFNKAVRNITSLSEKYISNKIKYFLYLEDDWVADNDFKLDNFLNTKYDFIRFYDDLDPRNKLSFQPSIMKPYVWFLMFYNKLNTNNDTKKDPEKLCQLSSSEINIYNFNSQKINLFKDIGRNIQFNDDNTIRGWYQKVDQQENISLSYIYIDRLIKSFLYLISIKKSVNIKEELIDNLKKYFYYDIFNKIVNKYNSDEKNFINFYQKCLKLENKKVYNLKYIYDHIDKLSETGAWSLPIA